jgi:carboxyl-terminal processing protease
MAYCHLVICTTICVALGGYTVWAQAPMSATAEAYLSEALAVMKKHSLRRERIDWTVLRDKTLARAAGADSTVDTWDAVRFALRELGDRHSFLQLSESLSRREQERKAQPSAGSASQRVAAPTSAPPLSPFSSRTEPEGQLFKNGTCTIAYVVVPAFMRAEVDAFATRLHQHVAELDRPGLCGWIVDLRGNGGGNMWPMLAGTGPLLGTSQPGASDILGQPRSTWFYREGRTGFRKPDGSEEIVARIQGPIHSIRRAYPVAVLIDGGTASSGEAIAVAFRGRPQCRFFGSHTLGVSSINQGFLLSDGANLVLTVGVQMDRNAVPYEHGIAPDETTQPAHSADSGADPTLRNAQRWLAAQAH